MPGAKTNIKIDGFRLIRELEKRNLTPQKASKELGFTSNFMSNVIRRGTLSRPAMRSIEMAFHIQQADIEKDEQLPEKEPQPQQIEMGMPGGPTYQEMITQAVADGIHAAFEAIFEEYAIYIGGVPAIRKRSEMYFDQGFKKQEE